MSQSRAFITKRPDDPAEARKWADSLIHLQVAMWVGEGAVCAQCQQPYATVDDFMGRRPRYAGTGPVFVDDICWNDWLAAQETEP